MKKTRTQSGYIFKKSGYWYVRFRQDELQSDGQIVRKQRAERLAPICSEYKSKKSVEHLKEEKFAELKLNSPDYNPQSTTTLSEFVKRDYFPNHVVAYLKPSVRPSLECNWRRHLEPLCGDIRFRDFTARAGQNVMNELARRGLGRNTLRQIKSLLSGIFSEAIRLEVLDKGNPIREVKIPKDGVRPPKETCAYTFDEIRRMMLVLGSQEKTVIAVAAFSGLRMGEIKGLRWENWHDGALWVKESAWRGDFTEPKSRKSKAPVPVIPLLAQFLEFHCQGRTEGLVFPSSKGTPLNLDNLARRTIRPTLSKHGLQWYGWHGFRRGLATNLNELGVDDKNIQAIMRHADYATTMNHYVKAVPGSVQQAMDRFGQAAMCTQCAPESESKVV